MKGGKKKKKVTPRPPTHYKLGDVVKVSDKEYVCALSTAAVSRIWNERDTMR